MEDIVNEKKRKVISLNIDLIDYRTAIQSIIMLGKLKKSAYVCFANVHMTIEAFEKPQFADAVNRATLVLADGVPLVKSIKLFYGVVQERVAGMDVMADLIREATNNQLGVFFFGSTNDILDRIRIRAIRDFPQLKIAGLLSPPFDQPLDNNDYLDAINRSGANLVFVALGCPKQEEWMAKHSCNINATLLGVGGAFPVYAGISKRAPLFMQKSGLEWLFRFFQEPKRLFQRYFKTNLLFIYLIFIGKLKG